MYDNLISVSTLKTSLPRFDWLVFDCRFDLTNADKGYELYLESHIPGAVYAHLDEHLSSPITANSGRHPLPDMASFNQWISSSGFNGLQQVVVYDDSYGAMASRLWWLLKCMGHEAVAVLDGGWQSWIEHDGETSDELPGPVARKWQGNLNPSCVVTTEQVSQNLEQQDFQLIDVRTRDRFNGIAEPIDPVAGHIPGAINMPLNDNLGADGCYKSPRELRELYQPMVNEWSEQQQVYMCGSGVTACHSVLAMCVAGYPMPLVYAGSWSEWIRDPARPLATRD